MGFALDGVVTNSTSVTTTHHDKHMESERIQFTDFSDHEILEFVNRKHFPEHEADFIVGDLFKITKTIIDHATNNSIFDNILQVYIYATNYSSILWDRSYFIVSSYKFTRSVSQ